MLLTKSTIKFNKFFVKIPSQTKRVWDLSENRWGYRPLSKNKFNLNLIMNGDFLFTIH